MSQKHAFIMVAEMKEFATFTAAEQRYIRRSLEVARSGLAAADRWCRNAGEADSITAAPLSYDDLAHPVVGSRRHRCGRGSGAHAHAD